jgi:chromate transport protein ChrA
MKKFLGLFLASIIVGFAVFAVFYWIVNWTWSDSFLTGLAAAAGGLVGEYLRPYFEKRKSKRVTERSGVRRNES